MDNKFQVNSSNTFYYKTLYNAFAPNATITAVIHNFV